MTILAGDPGVGKSFLSYALALCLATGSPFLGFPIEEPKRVLYFDEENAYPDLRAYLNSLWRGLGKPDPSLMDSNLRIEHFSLCGAGTPYGHISAAAFQHQPALVILDTVSPVCRITDENDNAEASAAIRELRRIKRSVPSCSFLLLKHAKYTHETHTRSIRGAKAWIGELDATIYHTLPAGRPRSGLRRTQLEPGKVRAYGLRDTLQIEPVPTNGGILLTSAQAPIESEP